MSTLLNSHKKTVPADNFLTLLAVNVDNEKMSPESFREFVRNTLPIVQYNDTREENSGE